ncbi:MAG: hypothetical protein GY839_19750 [candidate division Zixibacteria bacterium]|nr:hypothetical protein [candidate division Zixibacteria bacterium]
MKKKFKISSFTILAILPLICFTDCGKDDDPVFPDEEESDTTVVIDIDGNTYQTVLIGDQVWMAENLKVIRYRNGDPIPHVTSNVVWESLSTAGYCGYNNNEANVYTYGRLYNWYAVDDRRNPAPTGWHVPSDAEWQTLIDYLGGASIAGGKMKTTGTAHWLVPNTGATNESGFSALPGGLRDYTGHCTNIDYHAYFWSTSESDNGEVWHLRLDYLNERAIRDTYDKRAGMSIRCLRD